MGRGGDNDQVPAVPLHSLDVDLEGRLGQLEHLDQQLPLGLADQLRSLDFNLGFLDQQPSLGTFVS